METKFKVGDRVLCTDNGAYGNVTLVDTSQAGKYDTVWYEILFDNGDETWLTADVLELTDVDKKTAFLTELKELLEKYGVEIDINSTNGDEEEGIMFLFGKEYISYTSRPFNPNKLKEFIFPITPSNIFDYDKGEQPLP